MSMTPVSDDEGRGPRPRNQLVLAAYAAVLAIVAASIALLAVIVLVLGGISDSISHVGERRHLKPVPISPRACPYVALMHAAANDFQAHEPAFGVMFDAKGHLLPVAKERTIVGTPLARFELAIALSKAHFPSAVRTQLAI